MTSSAPAFCTVEFVRGSRLHKEPPFVPGLPVVQNGPPGTFVIFADGRRVPLPTDRIVSADDESGATRVSFGGMRWGGIESGQLTFHRVRDVLPEHAALTRTRPPHDAVAGDGRGGVHGGAPGVGQAGGRRGVEGLGYPSGLTRR